MYKKLLIISIFAAIFLSGCNQQTNTPFTIEYEKYSLDNGLTIILHEDNSDPIISVAIQYHVGSNRETPGRTGFAHLFEHMLFQESQHIGQDQFFKKIQNVGGTLNGGTNKDGTVYYEVVPKNALETVLWMESDRMGWLLSTVTQSAFENQQEVVQNEKRQRVDNLPYGHNNYLIIKNLYPEDHPYNWTTIGELEDLQNATLKDVRDFYEKWYGPNNATMVIAGDINKREVKKLVEKYFGEIKPSPDMGDPEPMPVQLTETKRVYHEDNFARSPRLTMVFPTVDHQHVDASSLELLSQLLADGKKAPLYKVIVEEKKLAPNLYSYSHTQEIAGTFNIVVTAFPTSSLTDVEAAVHEAFARFESDGFTAEDLERLKAKYETGFYQGISSVLGKGFQLAHYNEFYGSPDAITEELQKVLDVNVDDIKRVYEKYVKDQNYVMTSFVPKGKVDLVAKGSVLFPIKEEIIVENVAKVSVMGEMDIDKIPSTFDRSVEPVDGPQPRLILPTIWQHDYDNGISLYGTKHDELPLINFGIQIEGGMLLDDPEKVGVANLITDMMMEGTANKTPVELEEAIDALGSSIWMYTGKQTISVEVTTLKRNFDATLALVEEILFEPRWDETEFDRIKRETAESIKRRGAVPSTIASNVFNKLIYGDHILANSISGTVESVKSIELDDLKNYYISNFSADLATISIVGDINRSVAIKAFKSLVDKWEVNHVTFPEYEMPVPDKNAKVYFVDVPNAKQSELRIGYLGLARTDPDYFPATVMNMKLGGNFSGDVNLVLREEKGYTYGARTRFSGSKFPGKFTASSAVRSNATEESVNIFKDLMTAYGDPIAEDDLDFTKNVLLKSNARRFETLGALRGMIDNIATYHLPFDYINDQEEIVRDMTVESHNELARKLIRPGEMIYLVVGDAATQLEGLKSLGFGDPILLDTDGKPVR
ncbi:MAG: insulinase family protein [Candidatus Marinimicrobia bacterium]|nr:insulinase family protein [Candidatus Neomarinimicrobiota bacterium]